MTSLKELQQVCANVLKEFHQVGIYLCTSSSSSTSSQRLVYKKTNHTPCKQHVIHLYKNISSKKIIPRKLNPYIWPKFRSQTLLMIKWEISQRTWEWSSGQFPKSFFVCKFCLPERSDFHLNFVRVFLVSGVMECIILSFRETKDDMVKKIDEHVQLAIQDSRWIILPTN